MEAIAKHMRAIVYEGYGAPTAVMNLVRNRVVPKPKADEVLVNVKSCSVNAADRHMVRANYFIIRMLLGLFRPGSRVLGMDVAGTVVSCGKDVTDFNVGDEVVADIRKSFGGGFAEYAVVKSTELVKKPPQISFHQAATVPISGQAAMMGVTLCRIKEGDKVLINGASGGVGSFAVQLAKAQGAHVTAMCSEAKAERVQQWGADVVIDYSKTPVNQLEKDEYDAIFDAASFNNPNMYSDTLKSHGRFVLVGGSFYNMLKLKVAGRLFGRGAQSFSSLTQEVSVTENIATVFELMALGVVTPAIQEVVPLQAVPAAIERLEDRSVVGKIVVDVQLL